MRAWCHAGTSVIVIEGLFSLVLCRSGGDRLSRVLRHSTIGAGAFNGRVRDGIGFWARRSSHQTGATQACSTWGEPGRGVRQATVFLVCFATVSRDRSRLQRLPITLAPPALRLPNQSRTRITGAIKSIGRLVPVGSTRHRACTPGLSTWSSSTALKGGLVLRGVSRLDAFSGYPVRT